MTKGTVHRQGIGIDIPTRYSLLDRLQNSEDNDSWMLFFEMYGRLIHSLALKSGLSETEAQEVVQETAISVFKDIHKFKPDPVLGSFRGWLRNIVSWRIADQFRKRPSDKLKRQSTGVDGPVDLAAIPDTKTSTLDSIWQAEWQNNLFEVAISRVKKQVKAEHFQIFDLYAVKGWPVLKVARALDVSVGQVYLVKHRIAGLIKTEIQELEKELL